MVVHVRQARYSLDADATSAGAKSVTPEQKTAIQQDAERAANMGWTPNEKCPHPFSSEQGKLWVQAYWDFRARRKDEGQGLGGCGFETYDRRGK